MYLQRLK
ncbi:hypothetical protein CGLO_15485 [Colletotrichum gloeosporioides Cg-14]|nr:hypothetical protein CGLO_15485 [Colletotrichum gloeosporioides Cg-14]